MKRKTSIQRNTGRVVYFSIHTISYIFSEMSEEYSPKRVQHSQVTR